MSPPGGRYRDKPPRHKWLLAFLWVALLGVACDPGADDGPGGAPTEVIVLSTPGNQALSEASEQLAISSPTGMVRVGGGIVVADPNEGRVLHLAESDGEALAVLGRRGEGPGEFARPEVTIGSRPVAIASLASREGSEFLVASALNDTLLVRIAHQEEGQTPPLLHRHVLGDLPMVIDIVMAEGERTAVVENEAQRLIVHHEGSEGSTSWDLPEWVVQPLDSLIAARSEGVAPGPGVPRQYIRSGWLGEDGRAILVLIRTLGQLVAVEVDTGSGSARRIEIPPGTLPQEGGQVPTVTALVGPGPCYLVGTASGVHELCQ